MRKKLKIVQKRGREPSGRM